MANRESILIVDDYDDTREMLEVGLPHFGYKTYAARDGVEALNLYAQVKCQIAIVDVMLPSAISDDLNGYKVSAKIKEVNPDAIVVIVTGVTEPNEPIAKVRILDSHADKILTKPVTVDQVVSEIQYIQAKREAVKPKIMRAPRSSDDYLKAIVCFVLLGLSAWCISNRISDARWQGQVEGTLKSDQQHTQQLLKMLKDDVDMSWAFTLLLRDQMKESGLKPPSLPKRPNYSEELEK